MDTIILPQVGWYILARHFSESKQTNIMTYVYIYANEEERMNIIFKANTSLSIKIHRIYTHNYICPIPEQQHLLSICIWGRRCNIVSGSHGSNIMVICIIRPDTLTIWKNEKWAVTKRYQIYFNGSLSRNS